MRRRAICPIAWASDRDAFPLQFLYRIIPWVYDCWGPDFPRWDRLLGRLEPPVAFFSSRAVANRYSALLPATACHWVPEAIDHHAYDPGTPLFERGIGVLEIGRRWSLFGRRFGNSLSQCEQRCLGAEGDVAIPPGRLRSVLADSRVMVCVPKSVTHPEAAGGVETVTYRYFEAIASRCIVLGRCPDELRDLWGYNPVVEVDEETDPGFVVDVVRNCRRYQDLVDSNYERLQQVGLWQHRLRFMASTAAC
jgi:hypothetical protein